jgi:membrane-bound serine protease (ClpP class)
MAWFQEPLPNPFEPLSNSQNESQTESTVEAITDSTTEAASTDPAEIGEANRAGHPDEAQVAGQIADEGALFGQPISIPSRENLLQTTFQKPYLIEIDAQIDGFFDWFISKSLEQAKKNGADVVIIKLTSPGGELETSLNIARKLQEIDWAKTVVWIPEQAISGGAIMSLGADAIYMKKSAMFGDAGPIFMTPWGDIVDAEEKIVSYTAESIRLIAKESGLPVEVAAAMADRKLKVFSATEKSSGLPTFVNESQSQRADVKANFEIGEAIAEAGNDRFLTVGAPRAQQLMLCDETFESETNLLQRLSSEEVVRIEVTRTDQWVYTLNRPWLTTLILILGIICLYIEMTAPGVTLPGLISLLSFGLFFWSHLLGGTATGLEIMLFLLGTFALFVEIFVLPGFGVFGIAGIAMIGISLLMATQDFVIPMTDNQWKQFEGNGLSILLAGIVVAIIIGVQVFWFDSIPGLSRLQLRPEELPVAAPATSLHPAASLERGARGVCQSDLRPSGKAMIDGMLVDVLTEGDYVEVGSEVSIIRIEGNIITVRKVTG